MIQLKLALKYLLRKPVTLFAIISVLLGTTAFVVVLGVMDGYVTTFHERSRRFLSDMEVRALPPARYIGNPDDFASIIVERVPEVEACSPVISGMAVVKVKRRGAPKDKGFALKWCRFVGVDPEREYRVTGLDALTAAPSDVDDWIIPGADLLGVEPGDNDARITLVTSNRTGTGPPLRANVTVAAVVDFGLHQYDREHAYISRRQAARFSGLGDVPAATTLRVRIRDARRGEAVRRKVQSVLDETCGEGTFQVRRYQETSSTFRALQLQRNLSMLVLGCLFAAAGFAVVAICYMIVLQKIRDIGVLRTLGLSRRGVMGTFILYGVIACLVGVAFGMVLGVFILDHMETVRQTLTRLLGHDPFPEALYGMQEVPTEVNAWMLLTIVAIALVVSFFGSLYPAWKAARLNVVESLRYE